MMKRKTSLLVMLVALAMLGRLQAQAVVYDGLIAGTVANFTSSVPRTYMGQGFSIADPLAPVQITQARVVLVAGAALSYQNTRIRVQFWNTYDPSQTGTNLVFSNAVGAPIVFTTGPITTTGATAFTFTLPFGSPVSLTGLTNHGITFNWQSDVAGIGNFIDDTLLTTALRTGSGGPPPALTAGTNVNPGGGYFRNASGLTSFNFQAGDARTIANFGGLMFELSAVSVPEPATVALFGLAGCCVAGGWYRMRRKNAQALAAKVR